MTADPQPRSGPLARIRARHGHYLWLAAGWVLLLFLALSTRHLHGSIGNNRPEEAKAKQYAANENLDMAA